jgi:alkanesulfonate monooxygenase SsuD/methylene tetrahydromethanopterin reductase-like flavin-dependent oxidoreductase (luciferase family)
MKHDIFFSICQTPVDGYTPSEAEMFENFFDQVMAADQLGYGTAWIAESHLSSQIQKRTSSPVVPHWEGEIGLNVDFVQLAHQIFRRTKNIEAGSAIMNIICNGGPIAAAERVASFATLHGLDAQESRRIHVGFAYGRFEFMNRAHGIRPRNALEQAAWPPLKGRVFRHAAEIFCRLLRGDVLSSDDLEPIVLNRSHFRTDEHWQQVRALADADEIVFPPFWDFEVLQVVPRDWRRELVQPIVGSHDPEVQAFVNKFLPVNVFNLSITQEEVIEATHQRMATAYHPDGGAWVRSNMPRTTFVFLNGEPGLTPEQQRQAAHVEARAALGAYWKALQGTIDPAKVEKAANNALIGNPADVAEQAAARFHPDDRLMLWFDFFNHDNERVIDNMRVWMEQVAPRLSS